MTQASATYAADHYVQRLDLGADPFAPDHSDDHFYAGAMRRQLLDQLVHFGHFSDQVVLLVGSTGSGSSTLLGAMFAQLQQVMDCCLIDADVVMSPDQLLTSLSQQLRLDADAADNPAEFLLALKSCAVIEGEPEPVLIAVDQAHYMALENFELLNHLHSQADGVIHLVLAGEYQVEQLAKLAGFDSEQRKLLELEPLTAGETGDYLLGLLQSAGYAGDQPLSSDQLAVLHEQSGGNIAEIKQLVPTLLAADQVADGKRLNFTIPSAHIVAIAILAAALLLSYFYQGDETVTGPSQPVSSADTADTDIIGNPVPDMQSEPPLRAVVRAEPVSQIPIATTDTTVLNVPPSTATDEERAVQTTVPAQADKPGKATPSNNKPVQPARPEPVKDVAVTSVVTTPPPAPKPKPKTADELAVSTVDKQPAVATATTGDGIPVRERRLLDLPADHYMLQLLGTVDEQRVRGFVKQYIGRLPITYVETRRNAKPWFVALTGPYNDKNTAVAGIKVLPAQLQKQQPWPRTVGSIQRDIQKKRQ